MLDQNPETNSRRAMLMGLAATMAGATVIAPNTARAQAGSSGFQPSRHSTDAWMDALPGNHRIFIDTATGKGGAEGLLYSRNLTNATISAYAGEDAGLAMILCLRHFSTPFAFNDAMWGKYGEIFHSVTQIPDPNTGAAPGFNLMQSTAYGFGLPNFGNTIDAVRGLGVEIAICDAATQFLSTQIAPATGQDVATVYEELKANAVPGRFVSAGVMALTRAQEYGYSLLYAG